MIRVLLADDHTIVRKGIRLILESEPDIQIVDEATNGQEAVEKVLAEHPDVVVMDITMPILNGVEATKRIKRDAPASQVLALTVHEDAKYLDETLTAGASGYVLKRDAPADLVSAVRVVHGGQMFLPPSMTKHVVNRYLYGDQQRRGSGEPRTLTARELEVLRLLAEGHTAREIAQILTISVKTVDRHKENMMEKLHAHNRIELVGYAYREGLIARPDSPGLDQHEA